MKLLNVFLFSFIFLTCQNNQVKAQPNQTLVGTLENGKPVLTVDKPKMLATYNANLLKMSGIDAGFTEISIRTTTDSQYFLVFSRRDSLISSFLVTAVSSNFYALNTISCTTSACASEAFGCTPKSNGVACWPCNNQGKCTKTVSSSSLID